MGFLKDKCHFALLNEDTITRCKAFHCGNSDLDDFFLNEAPLYESQLLGKSYCFLLDEDDTTIVCAFTLSNDSIRVDILPNSREKKVQKQIPYTKQMRRYPGVLIGRLGINQKFAHQGVGTELMNFIKEWFIDANNKTGCRFIIVDSYNEEAPLNFYLKNGFQFLFSSEEQEAQYTGWKGDEKLNTRLMYFDLINL